ncbi:MAG: MFS transporter [Candidatus Marinimicrobia bacterium]|nr:MFS transporter [Candidatus Neomarinimicrobiota bacterium]
MFLHFFAFGSFTPILSLYLLKDLGFSGYQVGLVLAAGAISSVLTPIISSFVADKIIATERIFAISHLSGSILMFALYKSTSFPAVITLYFFYMAFIGPSMPLSDTIIFHHISDRRKYGNIRVWGTIGWIAVALFFGFFIMQKSGGFAYTLLLSSISSLVVAGFTFFIPATKISNQSNSSFLPVTAFKILMRPNVLVLVLITLLVFIVDRFYFYGSSPYLKSVGFPENYILPYLSIGQVLEICAMVTLVRFMTKFKAKSILVAGLFINLLRYAFLAFFQGKGMTIVAIALHGAAYTFIFSTIYILLDFETEKESRAGVHQLFRIIYLGLGTFLGNLAAGFILDRFVIAGDYRIFWIVPAVLMIVILMVAFFFDKERKTDPATAP